MGAVSTRSNAMASASSEAAFDPEDAVVEEGSLDSELVDEDETILLAHMQSNPVSGPARMSFVVPAGLDGEIVIGVYDVAGRLVRELQRGVATAGPHEVTWDGHDAQGHAVKGGAYFLKGRAATQRIEGRLILVR
jgi:hypothetical protein